MVQPQEPEYASAFHERIKKSIETHADILALLADKSVRPKAMTGPHVFSPLKPWDRRPCGRCHACLLRRDVHGLGTTFGWTPARALGDRSKASGGDV